MQLRDKVVLITGSTTGIGRSTARLCVAEGARVMVHGRREEAARTLTRELGSAAHYTLGSLEDPDVCVRIVQDTVSHFGRLDAVVNNAALTTRSNLESTDATVFDRIVNVNLRAPLLIIREAVRSFRHQGSGTVVNIGSINALAGEANLLAYSAAKGGLVTLSRNLANALATEHIRINHLNVGWVTTENEIALKQREGLPQGWHLNVPRAYAPTGHLLTPEQVAEHVVFWLSDRSAPANGIVYELEQYSKIGYNPTKEF